jgi:hypothetical protein
MQPFTCRQKCMELGVNPTDALELPKAITCPYEREGGPQQPPSQAGRRAGSQAGMQAGRQAGRQRGACLSVCLSTAFCC